MAREQRKLAAILAAEVVIPADELAESGTKELGTGTRTLRRARAKLTGDSALVGFARNRPLCPTLCSAHAVARRCQRR